MYAYKSVAYINFQVQIHAQLHILVLQICINYYY